MSNLLSVSTDEFGLPMRYNWAAKLGFDVFDNTRAVNDTSTFWSMQSPGGTTIGSTRYCPGSRVVSDTTLVKKREGVAMTDTNSHTEVYNRHYLRWCDRDLKGL